MIPKEAREKWAREFKEYSKHWPWYAKLGFMRDRQFLWCKLGKHIPVKMTIEWPEISASVWCQECGDDLTPADWDKFWKGVQHDS